MATAVDEFGLRTIDVKALIENMKADLASSNVTVRNAAINLLSIAHKQLGAGLADMLRSDVKPALMTALEDAFKRNPQEQVQLAYERFALHLPGVTTHVLFASCILLLCALDHMPYYVTMFKGHTEVAKLCVHACKAF